MSLASVEFLKIHSWTVLDTSFFPTKANLEEQFLLVLIRLVVDPLVLIREDII